MDTDSEKRVSEPSTKRLVIVLGFVLVGLALMALTLQFRVNPAEGSVVDERILGTPIHMLLLVTTMPAWLAGAIVAEFVLPHADTTPWYWYSFMLVFQALQYALLGWLAAALFRWVRRGPHESRNEGE